MVLYNETVGIDSETEQEWLKWMQEDQIPKVMATGYFTEFKIYKVLSQEDEASVSYSVQYFSENLHQVVEYLNTAAKALAEDHMRKFKNRHVAFRTLLQQVV